MSDERRKMVKVKPSQIRKVEFRGVTRVRARSLATHFLLQIELLQAVEMRRATSQVSFLMCPFCGRVTSSDKATTQVG